MYYQYSLDSHHSLENGIFPANQILREINFCQSGVSKSATLTVSASLKFTKNQNCQNSSFLDSIHILLKLISRKNEWQKNSFQIPIQIN